MPELRRVALLIPSYRGYGHRVLQGIAAYARGHWIMCHQAWDWGVRLASLRKWRPDGLIARLPDHGLAARLQRLGIPIVDPFGVQRYPEIPSVTVDHEAVAHLAADHLLERGIRHFAYSGVAGVFFSQRRRDHFVRHLAATGFPVHVFEAPRLHDPGGLPTADALQAVDARAVARWLRSLPRPLGLFACNDVFAQQVINACAEHGFSVPDEVAVIGVGNDDVLCDLCFPGLSSVDVNARAIGLRAAEALDRLMRGDGLEEQHVVVPPPGVVARQSTDVLPGADREVMEAIRYLRAHACEGIRVRDFYERALLSRSTLQRRISKVLGHSPKAEILRVQLHRVKDLLRTTDLPLVKVALRAGFGYVESMCRLFKRHTGQTAQQYRRQGRTNATGDAGAASDRR